jgi:hypothetical protein
MLVTNAIGHNRIISMAVAGEESPGRIEGISGAGWHETGTGIRDWGG